MSHLHRFFVEDLPPDAREVALQGDEAHHALRVARVRAGDAVSLFDGKGNEALGVFEAVGKQEAQVGVQQTTHHAPPRVALTLAVGGLHRDKSQETVIRRAAELGARRVCFWHADHSQRPIKASARWQKTAIEACKQCGRPYLPLVDTASSLEAFLRQHDGPGVVGMLTDAPADAAPTLPATDRLALVIGPEGDFSEQEQQVAQDAGLQPVSLGKYTYRSEVAAALLMTVVCFSLGELGPGIHIGSAPGA